MPGIHCKLIAHSTSDHVQAIYTGLFLLHRRGVIRLSQELDRSGSWKTHARLIVDGALRLHYDTFDGGTINADYLRDCDLYFKRSYARQYLDVCGDDKRKVHPLGLYFWAQTHQVDRFAIRRALGLPTTNRLRIRGLTRALDIGNVLQFTPRIESLEAVPDFHARPKVLFMVKAWDPHDDPDRPAERVAHRQRMNDVRAECIQLLRREFGEDFYGGFRHTEFARRAYPEALVPDNRLTQKRKYVELLKQFPICVATTGLHNSIGAKFGEYVAQSKAILSEGLNYTVPGDLREGQNYLQFESPEQCVEIASRLYSDAALRQQMMAANFRYYHAHLRPDALVLNTLITALTQGAAQ
jgi:hypothetical protein